MTWVKYSDLSPGDRIRVDAGFTCMEPSLFVVHADIQGNLWVPCDEGRHYLNPFTSIDQDTLVGFTKESS